MHAFQIKLHSLSARVIVKVVDPDEALQRLVHPLPRLGVQPVRLGRHGLHRAEGERRRHVEVRSGVATVGRKKGNVMCFLGPQS